MKRRKFFPAGKLPAGVLSGLLAEPVTGDPEVLVRGGVGEDAAVLRFGGRLLAAKADPVTFAGDRPGWYAVQVNANDIAASGGRCRWFLASLLLPEHGTDETLVREIFDDIRAACAGLGVELVGGHTEITGGLERPVVAGFMLGEAERLYRKQDLRPGDRLLLTKSLAVEGTALLAREFGDRLQGRVSADELKKAAGFLDEPGISVVAEARAAVATGRVVAMHDPTEGGLATALAELAEAAGAGVEVELERVPVCEETRRFCDLFGLDPLGLIASGSLLIACRPEDTEAVRKAVTAEGIACTEIGRMLPAGEGLVEIVRGRRQPLRRFERDEICRMYE